MNKINLQQAFADTALINMANPSSQALLASAGKLREYKRGEHIFRDKESVGGVHFLIRGNVNLYKIDSLGEKKVIFVYGSGTLLNEDFTGSLKASISCEVKDIATILTFPYHIFQQALSQDFGLCKAVMDVQAVRIRRLYRQLKNTSHSLRVDKRIAAKLWKLAKDYGKPCEQGMMVDLDISITYLAEMLAVKRETVSRQVKLLTELHLVALHKNKFYIPDPEALSDYFKRN
jgi:CRP-like cAMP-binding protein